MKVAVIGIGLVLHLIAVLLFARNAQAQCCSDRLGEIRSRGVLNCGVWPEVPGFSSEHRGSYVGFDIDICHAIAAAIFADAAKVNFVPLEHIEQFKQRDDVDLVVRRLTWTMSREARANVTFGPIMFYDGQGFLVPRSRGITTSAELAAGPICVLNKERHPETLLNFLEDRHRNNKLVLVGNDREAEQALARDRCEAYSADISWLAAARAGFAQGVAHYVILPDTVSKEPLAPVMRTGDVEFAHWVRWTLFFIIEAEEVGVTSGNFNSLGPRSIRVRRLLASSPGKEVAADAERRTSAILNSVGNYGEMFERNLGVDSPLKLDRGLNRLWINGGLVYAPPLD